MNVWSDDEEEQPQQNNQQEVNKQRADYSDSDDDRPKILKRKDEKLLDQVVEQAKKIKNCIDNKIFDEIFDIHEKLVKLHPQISKVFSGKETPKLYSKSLYLIQKSIELSEEDAKKVQKRNFLSKLKKAIDNESEEIKNVIEDYLVDKESDDELVFDKLSDISSDSIEDDLEKEKIQQRINLNSDDPAVRRLKWVKKEYLPDYIKPKEQTIQGANPSANPGTSNPGANANEKIEKILERLKKQDAKELNNDEEIEIEYQEKLQLLGQQNEPSEMIERLEYMVSCAVDPSLQFKIHNLIISANFEMNQGSTQELPLLLWRSIYNSLIKVNSLSEKIFSETKSETNNVKEEQSKEEEDDFGTETHRIEEENPTLNYFQGSIASFLEKLSNEVYKSLQSFDTSSPEFIEVLKNEIKLINLCLIYLNNSLLIKQSNSIIKARVSQVLLLHLYYRKKTSINTILNSWRQMEENILKDLPKREAVYQANLFKSSEELLSVLFNEVYSKLDSKAKLKSLLTEIYYEALNENFDKAKSLFNKTNISHLVSLTKDDTIKVFYNRALIQLGVSAFRRGEFEMAKYFLSPLCCLGTSRLRDNLCQTNEKLSTLEKEDKKKLIPYTMTLNLEEVEIIFYLTLMLEDTDKLLLQKLGLEDSDIYLKRQIQSFEKQIFMSVPESSRQSILTACENLLVGNLAKAKEFLLSSILFKSNTLIDSEELKSKVFERLKIVGLRCFLLNSQSDYVNLTVEVLKERFEIQEEGTIRKEINQLIVKGLINARWNNKILEFYRFNSVDSKYKMTLESLEKNIKAISENNITLLEGALKSSN